MQPSEILTVKDRIEEAKERYPYSDTSDLYEQFMNRGLHQCQVNRIEKLTRGQASNPLWFSLRWGLVTASKMKKIVKGMEGNLRCGVPCSHHLLDLVLKPTYFTNAAMQWGLSNEQQALDEYWDIFANEKQFLRRPGLFVAGGNPLVGATPDGLAYYKIPNRGAIPAKVVEVKCPYSDRFYYPEDAALKDACVLDYYGEMSLKANHTWYYQAQAQMGAVGVDRCDLVVYTTLGICRVKVYFDEDFYDYMMGMVDQFIERFLFPVLCQE